MAQKFVAVNAFVRRAREHATRLEPVSSTAVRAEMALPWLPTSHNLSYPRTLSFLHSVGKNSLCPSLPNFQTPRTQLQTQRVSCFLLLLEQDDGFLRLAMRKASALPVRPPPWRRKKTYSLSITSRSRTLVTQLASGAGFVRSKELVVTASARFRRLPQLWRLHKTRTWPALGRSSGHSPCLIKSSRIKIRAIRAAEDSHQPPPSPPPPLFFTSFSIFQTAFEVSSVFL